MEVAPDYDPKNPRCNRKQFVRLRRCSKDKDIFKWNKWRNPNYFREGDLLNIDEDNDDYCSDYYDDYYYYDCESDEDGLNDEKIWLQDVNFDGFIFSEGSKANELQEINLKYAHLEGSTFSYVPLSRAKMDKAYLQYGDFFRTDLRNASFRSTKLQHANLTEALLTNAKFNAAHLEGAILRDAFIEGAEIKGAHLEGADFSGVTVNKKTIITNCHIDEKTNFKMVDLDSALIEPSLLSALKTNIRRMSWQEYFKKHSKSFLGRISTAPMRLFWWLSDYGSSSERIFLSILISILFFTNAYLIIGTYASNAISLPEQGAIATPDIVPISDSYIRVICFAISTMVTLGFGGINVTIDKAFPKLSNVAFLVVTLNLVLGYLFLSVLVTRFGILFQSQAPEQKAKKTNNTILYFVALILLASSSYMLFCWEDIIDFINYAALITVLFGMGYFHFK